MTAAAASAQPYIYKCRTTHNIQKTPAKCTRPATRREYYLHVMYSIRTFNVFAYVVQHRIITIRYLWHGIFHIHRDDLFEYARTQCAMRVRDNPQTRTAKWMSRVRCAFANSINYSLDTKHGRHVCQMCDMIIGSPPENMHSHKFKVISGAIRCTCL